MEKKVPAGKSFAKSRSDPEWLTWVAPNSFSDQILELSGLTCSRQTNTTTAPTPYFQAGSPVSHISLSQHHHASTVLWLFVIDATSQPVLGYTT